MKRNYLAVAVIIGVIAIGAVAAASVFLAPKEPTIAVLPNVEEAQIPEAPTEPAVLPYGKVTLALGQEAMFKDIRITPLSIIEDSRCPTNVQCIQAGTVRVRTQIVSGLGTSTEVIELGKSITTEAETVTLESVTPAKITTREISSSDYRLTFLVAKRTEAQGKCYVGGCSSQLCTDEPNAVSTCEYREQYACYKTATCERQANGACGWSMTDTLRMCLNAT